MKYELILETELYDLFKSFPHDYKGLKKALNRVHFERKKAGFRSAKIISERDGEIFALDFRFHLA